MSLNNVILLLGSNLNNPKKNIENAIDFLGRDIGEIKKTSTILVTRPVEFVSNNFFCNIALLIKTKFSPVQLLKNLKIIERRMGRLSDSSVSKCYEDRIIDIDIVAFNGLKFQSKRLILPHYKHLNERDFSKILIDELKTQVYEI